jgi:hypothetical protein
MEVMIMAVRNATFTLTGGQSDVISEEKAGSQERIILEIANLQPSGGSDAFVSISEEADANKGRRIQPGQVITWSKDSGYAPPQGRVNIYSTAAISVAVYEEVV